MVEFLSFFLVLTTGPKPIELAVTPPVVTVEAELDGQPIATLSGRPWAFMCDFGEDPEPHELTVIGRDAEGREIDRSSQWINLGIQPARARMSFKEDEHGDIRALGLIWESIGQRTPTAIEVTFDGQSLAIEDPRHIPLPAYDPDSAHFISAELQFTSKSRSRAAHMGQITRLDASFGGEFGEEVSSDLTALPVVLAPRARMPSREKLGSWFIKDGRELQVQAVEKGPADVVVVRHPAAQRRLERLARAAMASHRKPLSGTEIRRRRQPRPPPGDATFGLDTHLRFVAPFAVPLYTRSEVTPDLFAHSERYDAEDTGLLWLTHQVPPSLFPFELAEAVALAGMTANASSRRRAVLVLLDNEPEDPSEYSPVAVRRYLRLLRVPLYVWSTTPETRTAWGEARFVGDQPQRPGSTKSLAEAVRALDRDLQRQRIVWLRGRHLPSEIELSAEAEGRLSLLLTPEATSDKESQKVPGDSP